MLDSIADWTMCSGTWNTLDKILLCTDGLVVTATDDEICRAVCAGKSAEESLDDLIALAKAQGAPDNVTAVLIEHE